MAKMGLCLLFVSYLILASCKGGQGESGFKPCCFPSAFRATVTDIRSLVGGDTGHLRLFEVYRDWDRQMQIHRILTFAPPGQVAPIMTVILDFKNTVQYTLSSSGDCHAQRLDYAMLDPCIPESASYLGEAYTGYGSDSAKFRTWSFRTVGQGRNVSITVAVTTSDCAPVMETISGTLGHASVDSLVMFTNFNPLNDSSSSIFNIPNSCFSFQPAE